MGTSLSYTKLGNIFSTCRFLEIKTNYYCAVTVMYDSMFEDVLIINLLVICCRDIILPFIGLYVVVSWWHTYASTQNMLRTHARYSLWNLCVYAIFSTNAFFFLFWNARKSRTKWKFMGHMGTTGFVQRRLTVNV